MNFNIAWAIIENKLEDIEIPSNSPAATVEIIFDQGSATLHAPRFFKDPANIRDTVSLAWRTYCRGHIEQDADAITEINILGLDNAVLCSTSQPARAMYDADRRVV